MNTFSVRHEEIAKEMIRSGGIDAQGSHSSVRANIVSSLPYQTHSGAFQVAKISPSNTPSSNNSISLTEKKTVDEARSNGNELICSASFRFIRNSSNVLAVFFIYLVSSAAFLNQFFLFFLHQDFK